ncbi:hypothetical protein M501DRAFT_198454 [Patellaria atrata CBS 101060]|uniref:Uncharacterized protein n=1 Tax=Patellaria atrata CBS 101060 TaxID=1346257 RepID=A0A9P4VQ11_9PEZI|nr:hypothetical protein M501DRAFT_198454 [Patellaria atrata CBS 101060]
MLKHGVNRNMCHHRRVYRHREKKGESNPSPPYYLPSYPEKHATTVYCQNSSKTASKNRSQNPPEIPLQPLNHTRNHVDRVAGRRHPLSLPQSGTLHLGLQHLQHLYKTVPNLLLLLLADQPDARPQRLFPACLNKRLQDVSVDRAGSPSLDSDRVRFGDDGFAFCRFGEGDGAEGAVADFFHAVLQQFEHPGSVLAEDCEGEDGAVGGGADDIVGDDAGDRDVGAEPGRADTCAAETRDAAR